MKTHAGRKLSRPTAHRKSLLRNMAASLLKHEEIKTTTAKAKEVSRFVDQLITRAKKQDLVSRRKIASELNDFEVYKKLFDVLISRFQERRGGYTRVLKFGRRMSDGADISIVKLLQ